MNNTDPNQNPAKTPGNVASVKVYQDTWDQLDEESLLLMTDKERGQLNAKLCRVKDPDCVACQ